MARIPEPSRELIEKLTEKVFQLRGQDQMIEVLEAVETVVTQTAIVPEGLTIGNAMAYGIRLQNRVIGEYFTQLIDPVEEADFDIEATHASLMQPEDSEALRDENGNVIVYASDCQELGNLKSLDLSEEMSEAQPDWSKVPPPDDMHIAMRDSAYRGFGSYCPNCQEPTLREFGRQGSGRYSCGNCDWEVEI